MTRYIQCIMVVLVGLGMVTSAWSQGVAPGNGLALEAPNASPQGSALGVQDQIHYLESQLRQIVSSLAVAEEKTQREQALVKAGLAGSDQLPQLLLERDRLRVQMDLCGQRLVAARRLAALAQPVDIILKAAGIRQAAEVLSRVSSLKISVDAKVPENIYVSTQAQGVPLGGIIEVVANSAHLSIAPGDDGDLVLRQPGKLMLNGRSMDYQGDNSPWSDDWTTLGGTYAPLGRRWLRLFENFGYAPSAPGQRTESAGARGDVAGGVVLGALGSSTLVVGEPGHGPSGESGIWLTAYRLAGGRLKPVVARAFHRLTEGTTAPAVHPVPKGKPKTR